ncbi:MAG: V-type ATP synthase subunit A, partial [Clostridia bacterium]|nr:V-type ATP synthase subunit A [Clostridia bacterium]
MNWSVNLPVSDVIYGINGPVVTVRNTRTFSMMEMVYVGESRLVGEVIGINDKMTIIQVYEETTGLKPGDPIVGTGAPMNVLLGPGIIDNIFDGIERPLKAIEEISGSFISRGAAVSSLDLNRYWN